MYGAQPKIESGERVHVVARDRLRGYAPLIRLQGGNRAVSHQRRVGFWDLIREGGAVAVTIPETVKGFRGWRYRWWDRSVETPFPGWRWP